MTKRTRVDVGPAPLLLVRGIRELASQRDQAVKLAESLLLQRLALQAENDELHRWLTTVTERLEAITALLSFAALV